MYSTPALYILLLVKGLTVMILAFKPLSVMVQISTFDSQFYFKIFMNYFIPIIIVFSLIDFDLFTVNCILYNYNFIISFLMIIHVVVYFQVNVPSHAPGSTAENVLLVQMN